jgi:hypothetical protein
MKNIIMLKTKVGQIHIRINFAKRIKSIIAAAIEKLLLNRSISFGFISLI